MLQSAHMTQCRMAFLIPAAASGSQCRQRQKASNKQHCSAGFCPLERLAHLTCDTFLLHMI